MTPPSTTITLVRHGHVHNPDNLIYGRLPGYGLSLVGRRQAEAAAVALRYAVIDALYCSPQPRAVETAEILRACHLGLGTTISPLIDEIDCYFEGHPAEEVEARGWDLYTGVEDGFEVPGDIAKRGARFIAEVRSMHPGRHVAAVTHGDVIAFTVLSLMRAQVHVSQKRTLDRYGISDLYPATASLTTLTFWTSNPEEVPGLTYVRPYDEDLALASLS
ncbi:MAG: histidine phosphatase family protein [Anaerolineae bacterium]|jgi:broad specificity phosphatase PhoE|nr:histidine phosphatase family protein [Anaerolineae bacterium]